LQDAFAQVTRTSFRLEQAYGRVREQVDALKKELVEKDAVLTHSLEKNERLDRFLEGILHNLPVGILVTDPEGRIRLANGKAAEILGRARTELEGDDCASQDLLRDMPLCSGVLMERKRGHCIYSCSVSPLPGGPGSLRAGWVVMMEDISQICRWKALAERKKRLASMGEMATRIAHEIRNPLGSMELNATMLIEETEGKGQAEILARRLGSGVRVLSQILANLLYFARGADLRPERFPVDQVVRDAVEFASPLLQEKGIRVRIDPGPEPLYARGDALMLRQALLNLVLNGMEAMEPGGRLRIGLIRTREIQGILTGRPVVKIRVEDEGPGIQEDVLDRIFDPFFTTKSRGTGLGLSIVNNILESHGGIVEVESRKGEGACFTVSLPLNEEVDHDGRASHPGGGRRRADAESHRRDSAAQGVQHRLCP